MPKVTRPTGGIATKRGADCVCPTPQPDTALENRCLSSGCEGQEVRGRLECGYLTPRHRLPGRFGESFNGLQSLFLVVKFTSIAWALGVFRKG